MSPDTWNRQQARSCVWCLVLPPMRREGGGTQALVLFSRGRLQECLWAQVHLEDVEVVLYGESVFLWPLSNSKLAGQNIL